MKNRLLKALSVLAAAAALAPLASAQLDPAYKDAGGPLILAESSGGAEKELFDGDKVVYNNTEYVVKNAELVRVSGPGPEKLPPNTIVKTADGTTGTIHKRFFSLGYYPLVVFSTGGSLTTGSGKLVPGTFTDNGCVFAANAAIALDHKAQFEVGGFYFLPYGQGNDLYQVDAKYMFNRNFGIQGAYIDSTKINAESLSYFLILRSQGAIGNTKTSNLGLELGLGAVNNMTGEFDFSNGDYVPRNSVNFSTFITLSYDLTKTVRILASDWYIRDRSDDVTRFGLGLSISF